VPINKTVDILMVDDREDGLIALEALLSEQKNYRLVKAQSGREAIRLVDIYDFAMILLDVQMPELDGFETAQIIRSKPRFQTLPIIFVTAINKDERYIYKGYEAGAVDYVFKPFDPVILKSKVAVFADLHVKNRMLREQARQLADLENLRRYRNLADSIPHMILRATPDGMLEYHNQFWSSYTGMGMTESLDSGWQRAIHPEDMELTLQKWTMAMHDRTPYEIECRIRRYDGTYRWFWVQAVPEMNSKGEVIAWLGTGTDIEDRRAMEQKVRESQRAAEAASDAKTHFLANMSHEIRTPLNAIMGFTELLLEPNSPMGEKMKNVAIVRRNCHQLLKIVDEILDISKVEAGELTIESVETNVMELLAEVQTLMMVQAMKKGIELKFEASSRLPSHVMTDSTRLRQILINIVGNAIKFTREGSVNLNARFATDMDGKSLLQFTVSDTGVGIDSVSAQKIFQPFSQADSSTTRLFGGTGLGLALARRLARAMGGDVRLLRSEIGRGSSFVVVIGVETLPHAQWGNQVTGDVDFSAETNVAAAASEPLRGKRILLVEDAEDNQFLIQQFLSKTGAIVEIANNGAEGVEKALHNDYEVVLMDIQMPLVDGYQATTQLREAGYDKPIIALTAHALQEERDKCLRTGCNGHITKPINRHQLISSLVDAVAH
jgi:PAS domain S-box-containing protein